MSEAYFKLWKNCDVFAPEHIGKKDILVCGERIYAIENDLSIWEGREGVEAIDLHNATVCPGFIDTHIHVTGGGGEQGPASRVPEMRASELFGAGITAALGLLGTDGVSRSLENLLFKCRALEEEGISTLMLTGNYRYPSPTLTGDVMRDISLIDKIIGVKIAMSDHRSSNITGEELIRLGTEARVSGMLSGKPGIVVIHVGASPSRLAPLFYALENSDIPAGNFVPTHCGRSKELISEAVRFNKLGGTIDFTAHEPEDAEGVAGCVSFALSLGADAERITISSDGCGSQPKFDERGVCTGLTYSSPVTLLAELSRFVLREKLPLETALRFFTENPARVLGLAGRKGCLSPGADADILALSPEFRVQHLLARGKQAVLNGEVIMKGKFER